MDVGVLEPGDQHAAGEVDHLGSGSDATPHLFVGPNHAEPSPLHRHRPRPAAGGIGAEDDTIYEGEVGIHGSRRILASETCAMRSQVTPKST
jgi:hypothetical protein